MRYFEAFLSNLRKEGSIIQRMVFVLFLCVVMGSCTATREQEIEGDVNEFRSWVNSQTNKLEERTEEDWKNTKSDFRRRTEELDQKQERFSARLKADYQQIKEDFKAREQERDSLSNRQARLSQWERDLLGQYANGASITAGNIQLAYSTFIDNVRARHKTWDNEDWEMAELVLEELNQRKEAFDGMADEAEVRIKAMQMEFEALRAGIDPAG
jgi:small-conductance mechanosensitive channel